MKIAFIVQPDWLNIHFGVRNVFISCFKILEQKGDDVHFVWFRQNFDKILFYRHTVKDEDLKSHIKQTLVGTKKPYAELVNTESCNPIPYTQFLGESIKNDYDAFVLTNPWLTTCPLDFGNKPKCLMCYDCGANTLVCLNVISGANDFVWGYAHNTGYQFAKYNDYHFLSVSEKTDKEIMDYYRPLKHSFLSPIPTYAFFDVNYDSKQEKENAVVLAAPFDKRKGIEKIPEYLNKLRTDFDTLYIYGTPRCGEETYENFYKNLKVKKIIHYNQITADDLISLYKKCKFLFFPSREEGLGLPIIEAQTCGCRVVTTNDVPMNQLLCSGGYLLTNDLETDVHNMKKILNDKKFDYANLSVQAKKRFSTEKIYDELMDILARK